MKVHESYVRVHYDERAVIRGRLIRLDGFYIGVIGDDSTHHIEWDRVRKVQVIA